MVAPPSSLLITMPWLKPILGGRRDKLRAPYDNEMRTECLNYLK